ncbi:hypothetical protein [Arthrobacter sp. ZGTC212]|uniref:hypothetical protein n=1 Tax=Arthrobacter sp. ZGTC212 TaxID=2058899 RepID=UPI000CE47EF0|nr:hypothetical protein [Arthrobacter sp. ZGTC212]
MKKPTSKKSPLWAKPINWLVAIMVAALGIALTNWFVPRLTDVINGFSETGDPVSVQVNEPKVPYPIALPPSVQLSDSILAELSQLSVEDQRGRLESLGGVVQGSSTFTVTVTGNRADEVRITDITPVVECSVRDAGTLVWTDIGFGAAQDSTQMHITLDENLPAPYFLGENGERLPFFPAKTISLMQDEQVVIVIHAVTEKATCNFELDMTVTEGEKTQIQRIKNGDQPFVRAPFPENEKFQYVYYGGNVCKNYTDVQNERGTGPSC